MKKLLFVSIITLFSSNLFAGLPDSTSIGIMGGYSSYNTFHGELYLNTEFKIREKKSEIRIGINNRPYQFNFDDVLNLNAMAAGFYGDMTIFPFNKIFFTGFRWELISYNWLRKESMNKIRNERDYSLSSLYTGSAIFLQLGLQFDITDKIGLRLLGQPGIHQFSISNNLPITNGLLIENHFTFFYNVNLGLEMKIN